MHFPIKNAGIDGIGAKSLGKVRAGGMGFKFTMNECATVISASFDQHEQRPWNYPLTVTL